MKLAWLCYREWDEGGVNPHESDDPPALLFEEPARYSGYDKIVPIVYAVIEPHKEK